ncbi:putative reverse transcriptase domain-containing protein [Tanacetum coccineum]
MLAQVSNRGNVRNHNGNVVNENVRNVIVNGNRVGYSYKEFLTCNPKEYDGKGDAAVLTRWIEKMEYVHDMSEFYLSHDMQKLESELWNYAMVGAGHAGHAVYTDRFHELARLVPHLVTPESRMIKRYVYGLAPQIRRMVATTKPKTIQKAVQILDKNGRDDNKRTNIGMYFVTIKPCKKERRETGTWVLGLSVPPATPTMHPVDLVAHATTITAHVIWQRIVELVLDGIGYKDWEKTVQTNLLLITRVRVVETKGARLGVGHSCWEQSLEPSDLGFKYEIEIASGQLVEIDKVIKGCKLEIQGHIFDIDLIRFGHGSFDVIIGMDWLSNFKAEIICHEKVVRIPLPDVKVLRVVGERPDEKARLLMSAKASDKKQEEIVVVRDFPEVFLDDLSGLLPIQEIEFRIKLTPGATPVARSL